MLLIFPLALARYSVGTITVLLSLRSGPAPETRDRHPASRQDAPQDRIGIQRPAAVHKWVLRAARKRH